MTDQLLQISLSLIKQKNLYKGQKNDEPLQSIHALYSTAMFLTSTRKPGKFLI